MKHKSRFILPILTFLTFGMVTGSIVSNNFVKEDVATKEADATTTGYANKIYLEVTSTTWGDWDSAKGIFCWVDGGSTHQMHKVSGQDDNRKLCTTFADSSYIGKTIKFYISNTGDSKDWTKETSDKDTSDNTLTIPAASSNNRWFKWNWGDNKGKVERYTVSQYTIGAVNNDTTTCTVSGEYSGMSNETCAFSVSVGTYPTGKTATIGQYSNSACSAKTNEFALDSSHNKTFSTFTFSKNYWMKPIFYDTLQYSLNGGSSWVDLTCDNPTSDSSITYSASSVSMTSGNEVQFRIGDNRVYPSFNQDNINLKKNGNVYTVQDTNSGNISISYNVSAGTYSINSFSSRTNIPDSFHIVSVSVGDYYPISYWKYDETYDHDIMRLTSDTDRGRHFYLNTTDKLKLTNSQGAFYDIYEKVPNSAGTVSAGYCTVDTAGYYYLEIQSPGRNQGNYNRIYLEYKSVTITFNANGHGTAPSSQEEINGVTINEPEDEPTETGYDFKGWYKEPGCTNKWNFATDKPSGNTTLYAKWDAKTKTISFDGNGSTSGSKADLTLTYNGGTTPVTNPFTRTGHYFAGWNTSSDGTGDAYTTSLSSGQVNSLVLGDKSTFYAQWTAQTYTITYKDQGNEDYSGSNSGSLPTSHTYGVATALVNGVKEGYTFDGWYTTSTCTGDPITSIGATQITDDITLYAKWTAKTYTVTKGRQFNGTLAVNTSGTYDQNLSIAWTSEGSTGYNYTKPIVTVETTSGTRLAIFNNESSPQTYIMSDAGTYYGEVVVNLSYTKTAQRFNIAFNKNDAGATGTMSSVTATYNEGKTLPTPVGYFSKAGYTFVGWSTTSGSSAEAKFATKGSYTLTAADINALFPGEDETVTLYAVWKQYDADVVMTDNIGVNVEIEKGLISSLGANKVSVTKLYADRLDNETITETYDIEGDDILLNVNLNPAQLAGTITFQLYDDDTPVGDPIEMTIGEVIASKIASSLTTDAQKDLARAILAYGNYTQKVYYYNTDNLPMQYLSTAEITTLLNKIESETTVGKGLTVSRTNNLGLGNITYQKIAAGADGTLLFRYIFRTEQALNFDDYTATVSNLAGASVELKNIYYDHQMNYCLEVSGIDPAEMGEVFTIELVNKANENKKLTVNYTYQRYLYTLANNGTTYEQQFAKAAYYYYLCLLEA